MTPTPTPEVCSQCGGNYAECQNRRCYGYVNGQRKPMPLPNGTPTPAEPIRVAIRNGAHGTTYVELTDALCQQIGERSGLAARIAALEHVFLAHPHPIAPAQQPAPAAGEEAAREAIYEAITDENGNCWPDADDVAEMVLAAIRRKEVPGIYAPSSTFTEMTMGHLDEIDALKRDLAKAREEAERMRSGVPKIIEASGEMVAAAVADARRQEQEKAAYDLESVACSRVPFHMYFDQVKRADAAEQARDKAVGERDALKAEADGEHDEDCNGGLNEACDCTRIATKGELRHMVAALRRNLAKAVSERVSVANAAESEIQMLKDSYARMCAMEKERHEESANMSAERDRLAGEVERLKDIESLCDAAEGSASVLRAEAAEAAEWKARAEGLRDLLKEYCSNAAPGLQERIDRALGGKGS